MLVKTEEMSSSEVRIKTECCSGPFSDLKESKEITAGNDIKSEDSNNGEFKYNEAQVLVEKSLLPSVRIKRNLEIEKAVKGMDKHGPQDAEKNCAVDCEEYNDLQLKSLQGNSTKIQEVNVRESVTMFVCADCDQCYREKIDLEDHICFRIINKSKSFVCLDFSRRSAKMSAHVCSVCYKSFSDKSKLKIHEDIHYRSYYCTICKLSFSCKKLLVRHCKAHLGLDTSKSFACGQCNKVFKSKAEIKSHLITHSKKKSYFCNHCEKSFKRKGYLPLHMERWHSQDPPKYTCKECSKSFFYKRYLKVHKFKVHSKSRPLICCDCGDSFNDKDCLRIHSQTHSGIKPFSCSFCCKQFAQSAHVRRHELVHTGVKPHVCKVCNKSFRDTSNLKVHEILHSGLRPFKCDDCEKSFKQRSHLNTHKKTHSNERTFYCDICEGSFKDRGTLKFHLLTHSNVKPFNCDDCGRSFVQITHFKRHKCYWGSKKS